MAAFLSQHSMPALILKMISRELLKKLSSPFLRKVIIIRSLKMLSNFINIILPIGGQHGKSWKINGEMLISVVPALLLILMQNSMEPTLPWVCFMEKGIP